MMYTFSILKGIAVKDSYSFQFDADSLTDRAKLGTAEGLESFIEQCSTELVGQNKVLEERYGIGKSNWNADLLEGTVRFSHADGLVVADVEVVGTVNTNDDSFLWACDNRSFNVMPEIVKASQQTKDFLDDMHYLYMWESPINDLRYKMLRQVVMGETAIPEAQRLTAVANKLSGALGAFAPMVNETQGIFFLIKKVR